MNIYAEMLKYFVFTIEDVNRYYNNMNSAFTALRRLIKSGKAKKIRANLYTCISLETGSPVANRFQVASFINETSYISHHTAMEYYGISDQVYYDVYVSSNQRFSDFEFDGYYYHFIRSRINEGIITPEFSGGIKISDKERTLLDCIKDMDKYSGIEETVENIREMKSLNEDKLLQYLEQYNNQFLYQKTGCLLSYLKETNEISKDFIESCHARIGKSIRYLTNSQRKGVFNAYWKLIVPENFMQWKNGVVLDAAV